MGDAARQNAEGLELLHPETRFFRPFYLGDIADGQETVDRFVGRVQLSFRNKD